MAGCIPMTANVVVAEVLGCTKPVQGVFAHQIVG